VAAEGSKNEDDEMKKRQKSLEIDTNNSLLAGVSRQVVKASWLLVTKPTHRLRHELELLVCIYFRETFCLFNFVIFVLAAILLPLAATY